MASDQRLFGYAALAGCILLTVLCYLVLVPRHALAGAGTRALGYLVLGWLPYVLVWYLLGRLFSNPRTLPSMRSADLGLGLVLVSLLVSLGLDAWGFSPDSVPEAHVLQAIALFVGLALFGWGIGRRSRAITGDETA